MVQVREKMTADPVICESTDTIATVAKLMRDKDIGDVFVKFDGSFGIVTDRDLVVRGLAAELLPEHSTVGYVASRTLETVSPADDVDEVVRRMREHNVRRIPVYEDGQPVGVLSLGDLAMMRDQDSALADISAAAGND